jgi:hypothetical protein
MGQVALGAALSLVMVFGSNLVHPFRPGRFGFMAPQALNVGEFDDLNIRIIGVTLAHSMAGFAGNGLVLEFGHLMEQFRMAFVTRFLSGENWGAIAQFLERRAPIPSKLPEGSGLEHVSGREVKQENDTRQQKQPSDLGWGFE